MRVMIVDDSAIIRQFLRGVVEDTNPALSVVGEAADGKSALETFAKVDPDVITLDITMPGMSGMECMKEILARKPETRVIVVTALTNKSTMMSVLEKGAVACLNKPVEVEQLKEVLLSFLD